MVLNSSAMLDVLRAVGEETRLRVVLLLQQDELTVTDLTEILGQSQPRISRHLKLLVDAGVVDRHREGSWVYHTLVTHGPIGRVIANVTSNTDPHDPVAAADLDRLSVVHQRRTAAAQQYFADIARSWDEVRSLHAPDEVVEAAICNVASRRPYTSVLDLGTGTGRMLQLLAGAGVDRVVGLDNSHSMLAVARSNLERAEIRGVELRQGDVYSPPLERASFDLIVVHQVLHYLDDPGRAIREAARLLTPGGRLLLVDFAPHALEFLRTAHAHRRLGFRDETIVGWLQQAGLDLDLSLRIEAGDDPDARCQRDELLTVSLWAASAPGAMNDTTLTPHKELATT